MPRVVRAPIFVRDPAVDSRPRVPPATLHGTVYSRGKPRVTGVTVAPPSGLTFDPIPSIKRDAMRAAADAEADVEVALAHSTVTDIDLTGAPDVDFPAIADGVVAPTDIVTAIAEIVTNNYTVPLHADTYDATPSSAKTWTLFTRPLCVLSGIDGTGDTIAVQAGATGVAVRQSDSFTAIVDYDAPTDGSDLTLDFTDGSFATKAVENKSDTAINAIAVPLGTVRSIITLYPSAGRRSVAASDTMSFYMVESHMAAP